MQAIGPRSLFLGPAQALSLPPCGVHWCLAFSVTGASPSRLSSAPRDPGGPFLFPWAGSPPRRRGRPRVGRARG
eukprot:3505173-Pyramimonas_sp.AAC.1